MRRTKPSRQGLSPLRTLDFDYLAAVIFAANMQLEGVVFVPVEVVREHMGWSKTWKSNRLSVTHKLLNTSESSAFRRASLLLVPGARLVRIGSRLGFIAKPDLLWLS